MRVPRIVDQQVQPAAGVALEVPQRGRNLLERLLVVTHTDVIKSCPQPQPACASTATHQRGRSGLSCEGRELNPHARRTPEPKSGASANFATRASIGETLTCCSVVWQVSPSFRLNLSIMGAVMHSGGIPVSLIKRFFNHSVPNCASGVSISMTRSRTRGSGSLPFLITAFRTALQGFRSA